MATDKDKVVEYLEGTCKGAYEAAEAFNIDEDEVNELIADDIFLCATCGWWCEMGEAREGPQGEDVCGDCSEDDDDE